MTDAEDHALILDTVDQFCRRRLTPEEARRRDENHVPPYDLIPELADLGLFRAPFPAEIGGLGLPWSLMCRIQERIAYHAFPVASIINRFVAFGGMPLLHFGSEEQKSRFLPGILDGRILFALALTEPEAGSDARAARSRATRSGDGWSISGRKVWISDAGQADYLLTLCRTPEDGERSLTAFLIPRDADGISMTMLPKVGHNCMPSWDIGFDEVKVEGANRFGAVGEGFAAITGTLKYSRASQAAGSIGVAQAAFDLAIAHARERHQFGSPLSGFQVIRHRLVDMHLELMRARMVVYALAETIDNDGAWEELGAAAKLSATEALNFITDHGMQILASSGYAMESPMQRYWRDAKMLTFGEGTSEIQREIIARELGLVTRPRRGSRAAEGTARK